jgi:hypothetical protein
MNLDLPLEKEFPFGAIVYHKVSGEKGMVMGHTSYCDGTTFVILSTGLGSNTSVMPETLTLDNPELKPIA